MENTQTFALQGKITSECVENLKKELSGKISLANSITVCLSAVSKTDLAGFNALVAAYMQAKRANKELVYVNCREPKLVDLISQTRFNHVFVD